MNRTFAAATACLPLLLAAAPARASDSKTVETSISIDEQSSVIVVQPLAVQTLSANALSAAVLAGAAGPAITLSNARNGRSNAALTIYGQSLETVSLAVPTSFKVTRTGGTEALTMVTDTNVEYGISGQSALLGGVASGDTMSVNVGTALQVAATGLPLVPGPYQGALVLVVQYN